MSHEFQTRILIFTQVSLSTYLLVNLFHHLVTYLLIRFLIYELIDRVYVYSFQELVGKIVSRLHNRLRRTFFANPGDERKERIRTE